MSRFKFRVITGDGKPAKGTPSPSERHVSERRLARNVVMLSTWTQGSLMLRLQAAADCMESTHPDVAAAARDYAMLLRVGRSIPLDIRLAAGLSVDNLQVIVRTIGTKMGLNLQAVEDSPFACGLPAVAFWTYKMVLKMPFWTAPLYRGSRATDPVDAGTMPPDFAVTGTGLLHEIGFYGDCLHRHWAATAKTLGVDLGLDWEGEAHAFIAREVERWLKENGPDFWTEQWEVDAFIRCSLRESWDRTQDAPDEKRLGPIRDDALRLDVDALTGAILARDTALMTFTAGDLAEKIRGLTDWSRDYCDELGRLVVERLDEVRESPPMRLEFEAVDTRLLGEEGGFGAA